ncbi:hypothetical protein [Bacillus sp. 3255]|uniref:hypothetical protein n=1 Tax=Bacillus sp. 3255 TaxID=2817904 RepID=UPI00286C4E1E|nr:hypothetical protein [Bacillus sp. 3255]
MSVSPTGEALAFTTAARTNGHHGRYWREKQPDAILTDTGAPILPISARIGAETCK